MPRLPLDHPPSSSSLNGMKASTAAKYAILGFASLFFLSILLFLNVESVWTRPRETLDLDASKKKKQYDFPDFNKYIHVFTLNRDDVGLNDPNRRVAVIGDIHGMNQSFHNLLSAIEYSPQHDTIILAGDFLTKATHAGSLAVLEFLTRHSPAATSSSSRQPIYAVRGNHDQMVIQWRAWRDWFTTLHIKATLPSVSPDFPSYSAGKPVETGARFLERIEKEWEADRANDPKGAVDPDEWTDIARKRAAGTWREEWWRRIPTPGKGHAERDWHIFTDHYWLARDLNEEQTQYLYSLPLIVHVPSAHFFVAHAGLLPYDPRYSPKSKRQPLAHSPRDVSFQGAEEARGAEVPGQHVLSAKDDESLMRVAQEKAILHDVALNHDPYTILNMRGVTKKGKITREGDVGLPWSELWNDQMGRCEGFRGGGSLAEVPETYRMGTGRARASRRSSSDGSFTLPCRPSTVVYGHAASRDLDVKRWTAGLDTGCLYGRRLTALILQRAGQAKSRNEFEDRDVGGDKVEGDDVEDDRDDDDDDPDSKTWTRRIRFGDDDSHIDAHVVSVKCPKSGDFIGEVPKVLSEVAS